MEKEDNQRRTMEKTRLWLNGRKRFIGSVILPYGIKSKKVCGEMYIGIQRNGCWKQLGEDNDVATWEDGKVVEQKEVSKRERE